MREKRAGDRLAISTKPIKWVQKDPFFIGLMTIEESRTPWGMRRIKANVDFLQLFLKTDNIMPLRMLTVF